MYSEKLTGVTGPVWMWPRQCASVEQVSSRPPHAASLSQSVAPSAHYGGHREGNEATMTPISH